MNDAEEIIKKKKDAFEACSAMFFMRGSDKRKYGELIHDFSIHYAIKKYKYLKIFREAVDVMHKVRFKTEKNNDESDTQKHNKIEVVSELNKMIRV